MPLVIDDRFLPATLNASPMTDNEFATFCAEHPDLNFEMTAEGELIAMAPTHYLTGFRNQRIGRMLDTWAEKDGRGMSFDSSTGFVLPDGARRSPDASWALVSRIDQTAPTDEEVFLHLCPDFVIELRSGSDRLTAIRTKMHEYVENGCQLGWLIDPQNRSVEIYRPGREMETLSGVESISGEGPVSGFVLDLKVIWNPRGR